MFVETELTFGFASFLASLTSFCVWMIFYYVLFFYVFSFCDQKSPPLLVRHLIPMTGNQLPNR